MVWLCWLITTVTFDWRLVGHGRYAAVRITGGAWENCPRTESPDIIGINVQFCLRRNFKL